MRIRHSHGLTRRQIERCFLEPLAGEERRRLFATLDTCARCAETYRRYARLEGVFMGQQEPLSDGAVDRVERALLATLDRVSAPRPPSLRRWAPLWVGAAVSAVLALLLWPAGPGPHRVPLPADAALVPALVARGPAPADNSTIGIRVFQVIAEGRSVTVAGDLTLDDVLTFTYTRVAPGAGYLMLFGWQKDGVVRWYYPDYGEATSVAIAGDKVDEPLDDGIVLGVNHRPGWLRLSALFSEQPLERAAVEAAVETRRARDGAAWSLEPLSQTGWPVAAEEYSILLELAGEGP